MENTVNEWKNWVPTEDVLSTVQAILHDALVPDSDVQRNVHDKVVFLQSFPDFAYYLLYILGKSGVYSEDVRCLSGIMLKNNISETLTKLSEDTKSNLKKECLRLLKDPLKEIRNSVSNVIVVLACKQNICDWPELIPHLTSLLENQVAVTKETSMTTLFKICDEYIVKRNIINSELSNSLAYPLLKFVDMLSFDSCTFRKEILRLLNDSIDNNYYSMTFIVDMKYYVDCLLKLCGCEDMEVQKYVCQAFVILVEHKESALFIHMPQILCFLLQKTGDDDEKVALQACEFWLAVAKLPTCCESLQGFLEHLVPVLLNNMKYSEYELNALKDVMGNDAHVQDNFNDVRPFTGLKSAEKGGEFFDDDEYDEGDMIDDPCVGWTLRKCSAASLDALSVQFQSAMTPIVLNYLKTSLYHEDVLVKEAAVLALGAIADGCLNSMHSVMPQIVTHLLTLMKDECSIIRVITCWTLSRYVNWIISADKDVFFTPVMTELLLHFMDKNKRVQRAAISAFCIFQEEACFLLVPYIDFILQVFLQSFSVSQYRSNLLLFDAIGVLAQSVGNHLNKPQYIEALMPPLMDKFNACQNFQEEPFLALLECLSNIAQALEVGFLPYTEPIYIRCLLIIQYTLETDARYKENPTETDLPYKEPMIVAHDMLLSMAVSLKSCFVKYVTNSNLLVMLHATLQDEIIRVRIPALALFGELVKLCYSFISPNINEFVPVVIKNLNKCEDGACNNAAWVIGKLCLTMGPAFQPYVNEVLECYSSIMENPIVTKAMYQTVAISVCTLGLVFPEILSPVLNLVLSPCCLAMRNVRDCEEKDVGFRGLCQMIFHNPDALRGDFMYFCDAVASWNEIKPDLKETIKNILFSFKEQIGEESWAVYSEQFPPMLKVRLANLYSI